MSSIFNAIYQFISPPAVNTEQNKEEDPMCDWDKLVHANMALIEGNREALARGEKPDEAAISKGWYAISEFEGQENMERMEAGLPPLSAKEQALERESYLREKCEKKDWTKV